MLNINKSLVSIFTLQINKHKALLSPVDRCASLSVAELGQGELALEAYRVAAHDARAVEQRSRSDERLLQVA
jgi:hypothetical protein